RGDDCELFRGDARTASPAPALHPSGRRAPAQLFRAGQYRSGEWRGGAAWHDVPPRVAVRILVADLRVIGVRGEGIAGGVGVESHRRGPRRTAGESLVDHW